MPACSRGSTPGTRRATRRARHRSNCACSNRCTSTSCGGAPRRGPDTQPRSAQIMERLAQLTTRFAQNVLADEAGFQLELSDAELDGLPPFVRAAARQAASDRGLAEGTHVVQT